MHGSAKSTKRAKTKGPRAGRPQQPPNSALRAQNASDGFGHGTVKQSNQATRTDGPTVATGTQPVQAPAGPPADCFKQLI